MPAHGLSKQDAIHFTTPTYIVFFFRHYKLILVFISLFYIFEYLMG